MGIPTSITAVLISMAVLSSCTGTSEPESSAQPNGPCSAGFFPMGAQTCDVQSSTFGQSPEDALTEDRQSIPVVVRSANDTISIDAINERSSLLTLVLASDTVWAVIPGQLGTIAGREPIPLAVCGPVTGGIKPFAAIVDTAVINREGVPVTVVSVGTMEATHGRKDSADVRSHMTTITYDEKTTVLEGADTIQVERYRITTQIDLLEKSARFQSLISSSVTRSLQRGQTSANTRILTFFPIP
jgi:hypothetical protein